MNISTANTIYPQSINFQGNKLTRINKSLSLRDIYSNPDPKEFIELRKIYNSLWEKLSLPENLKPRLQYKAMLSEMGFSPKDYTIFVKKNTPPFKMNVRNKTGKNESFLRHEIEHVKQIWDIIRFLGVEGATKEFKNSRVFDYDLSPNFIKKMKEIRKTLGPIEPNTKEAKNALQYIEAVRNYPDMESYNGVLSFKDLINGIKYRNNTLEKNANLAEKNFRPSLFKTIKITFKEFIKLLSNQ